MSYTARSRQVQSATIAEYLQSTSEDQHLSRRWRSQQSRFGGSLLLAVHYRQRYETSDIKQREVVQMFLEIKPIRKETKKNYHHAVTRHFDDWLDMPITAITKDMVEQRHQELTVRPNRLGDIRAWTGNQCP